MHSSRQGFFVPTTASIQSNPVSCWHHHAGRGFCERTSCFDDADDDGLANIVDDDDDNDGVMDGDDAFPLDASASRPIVSAGLIGFSQASGWRQWVPLPSRHRRMGDQQSPSGVDSGTDGVAHPVGEKSAEPPSSRWCSGTVPGHLKLPTPSVIENYTQLPHGGSYDQSTGETVYGIRMDAGGDMMPDGRFVQME